jgi:hypothetical protein
MPRSGLRSARKANKERVMAKSKKVRIIKASPVLDSQLVEIGNVVEDQEISVEMLPGSDLAAITDPCPWGAFGVQGLVAKDAFESMDAGRAPRHVPEPEPEPVVEEHALPSEPQG